MLNKTLTLSAIISYSVLLLLVTWQQAKVIPWDSSSFLRINFARSSSSPPPLQTPAPPNPFNFTIPPLAIDQNSWSQLQFHSAKGPITLELQQTQQDGLRTILDFDPGVSLILEHKDNGMTVSVSWEKNSKQGEFVLPLALQPDFQWKQERNVLLAIKRDQRWMVSSDRTLSLQDASLVVPLPAARKGENMLLFTLTPAPVPESKFFSEYSSYLTYLERLVTKTFPQKNNPTPTELVHYFAANLRQGTSPKKLALSPNPYQLSPYLGLELSTLRRQVALDQQRASKLLLRTPSQLLASAGNPSPATFLFNHYQLDKLRQLLRYSLSNLPNSTFEQKLDKIMVLSEILLINPVMVSAQGDLAQVNRTMEKSILPTVEKWLNSPPSLPLRKQLRAIALLNNWSRYSNSSSAGKLAEQLTLQLQQYQDPDGNLNTDNGERVSLSELLDWIGPTQYLSMERSVTPGFWVQGISAIQTDYRPGYFIRVNTTFPAGKTQYLVLRGIYFQPRQVFFDKQPQPYHDWASQPTESDANSWYYNRELKTLVIKATHPKENLVIDIPY